MTTKIKVRAGQGPRALSKAEFELEYRQRFFDPAFNDHQDAIEELLAIAWNGYNNSRKSPVTRKAGPGYADPSYELSIEWLGAKRAIDRAKREHGRRHAASRILLICGSPRNDKSCPGEMSKSFRMVQIAKGVLEDKGDTVDVLDLSLLDLEPRQSDLSL
jgi:hypothetical protein